MLRYLLSIHCICFFAAAASAEDLQVHRQKLANGIRVTYLHVPGSKNFSMFSFLPMGLAGDDANHAQWAHLVEHLTIRTTIPDQLFDANAETQADHMRLDYYGTIDNWREALSHHQKWLQGLPFDEQTLKVEAPRANSEADSTAANLFSGKFAVAAWNQAYRHRLTHAAVKQDLLDAKLADIQRYRDEHLFVPERTVICAIGGVAPQEALTAISQAMGGLKSAAKTPEPLKKLPPIDATITWDLSSRQLMYCWPVCGLQTPTDYAALQVIATFLTMQASQDAAVAKLCGPIWCGTDLVSPEGPQFSISATLKSGADASALRARFDEYRRLLADSPQPMQSARIIGSQLADTLKPRAFSTLLAQVTDPSQRKFAEAQFGLMWGTADVRLGDQRDAIIKSLEQLKPQDLQHAVDTYLRPEVRTTILFVPK